MGLGESGQCRELTDTQVVHHTKQFFTINKIVETLSDLESGAIKELSPPQAFMIDIVSLIPDLMSGEPTDLTLTIFKPKQKIIGIRQGVIIDIPYTAIHMYNDFVLNETPVLDFRQQQARASIIKAELMTLAQELIKYISAYCSDVGLQVPVLE